MIWYDFTINMIFVNKIYFQIYFLFQMNNLNCWVFDRTILSRYFTFSKHARNCSYLIFYLTNSKSGHGQSQSSLDIVDMTALKSMILEINCKIYISI